MCLAWGLHKLAEFGIGKSEYDEGYADEGAYWDEQETYDDPEQHNVADEQSYGAFATGVYADHDNGDHPGGGAMYPGRASQLGAQFR
eukprot:1705622-Rhodomonas_salina.1